MRIGKVEKVEVWENGHGIDQDVFHDTVTPQPTYAKSHTKSQSAVNL